MYHRSLDININLIWGIVLLVFGGLMLIMAMRAKGGDGPRARSRRRGSAREKVGTRALRPAGGLTARSD